MSIKIKKQGSLIDNYAIAAPALNTDPPKSLCITWNHQGTNALSPALSVNVTSYADALSTSYVSRGPNSGGDDAHLVVSKQIFDSIRAKLDLGNFLWFTITPGDLEFSILCAASIEEGDPTLRDLLETATATGQTVKSIDGHLAEIKGLLVDFMKSQRPPAKASVHSIEFVGGPTTS